MHKKKRIIVVAIFLALGIGTVFYIRSRGSDDAVTYKTASVTKGTLTSTVSGSGNIVVSSGANVNPSISGTVEGLAVSVGDKVTAGQTLFTIVNDDLDLAVDRAYTSLLQARQKLTQAEDALDTANDDYNDLKKDPGVNAAQLAYDQSNQELAQAKIQLEQDEDLLEKYEDENDVKAGTHSKAEIVLLKEKISVDKTTITAKEKAVFATKETLDRTKVGTTPEIEAAKTKVNDAKLSVQIAENDVASAEKDYASQRETAAERTVTAPIDGTVSDVSVENGDELGNTTSTSAAGSSAAMVIQDLTSLKANVSINEVDIASVQVDQTASMAFDAISDLTLTGKVEKVDTLGTSTQGVVTYSATIGFDVLDERVRPEMSTNATITTAVKQDVLIASSSAVKTSGDSHYVLVMQDGAPVQQTVEVGVSNDTQTEITSGVSEGTEVVTQTITASSESSTSSSSSSNASMGQSLRMFQSSGAVGGPPGGGF